MNLPSRLLNVLIDDGRTRANGFSPNLRSEDIDLHVEVADCKHGPVSITFWKCSSRKNVFGSPLNVHKNISNLAAWSSALTFKTVHDRPIPEADDFGHNVRAPATTRARDAAPHHRYPTNHDGFPAKRILVPA